jgi:hypothetical protein
MLPQKIMGMPMSEPTTVSEKRTVLRTPIITIASPNPFMRPGHSEAMEITKEITKAMKNKLKISSPIFRSSSMGCAPVVGLCAQPLGVRREK